MNARSVLQIMLAALCGAGLLSAQHDAEAGRRGGATAPPAAPNAAPRAVAPRMAARMLGAPPLAEHGFRNDVEAGRMLPGTGAKSVSDGPDSGKPVEIAPHGQCQFEISVNPSKLMAGQTGTVKIVMLLLGDSVMESAADLRIVLHEGQDVGESLLALGAATIKPPRPANLAAAYRGRQVYDNWAVVELPITMSPAAPSGSLQSIDVEAVFRLHEGSTGRLFGEYRNPLLISCEVGPVLDPAVRQASTNAHSATTDSAAEQQVSSQVERASNVIQGAESVAAPDRVRDPLQPAPHSDVPTTPDSSGVFVLGGAGLLVLATLALFLRRR